MIRAIVAVTLVAGTLAFAGAPATPAAAAADMVEDFEGFAVGADPVDWVDTAASNSMVEDDSLFSVMAVDGSQVLGTTSSASNIHSHHVGGAWADSGGYAYSGRMTMADQGGGVGVTMFSDYDQSDSYYRLRRYGSGGSFQLSAHGASLAGDKDTGVVPTAGVWYQFEVEVEDTGTQTEVRARVWEEGTAKPADWQADAFDDGGGRLTSGTVGVWSMSSGAKYWDDFSVSALSVQGPHVLTVTSTGNGSVSADPDLAEYAHGTSVDLTATPDAGWEFVGWSGGLTGAANPATVVMDQAVSVEALFSAVVPATVTTQVVGNGSVAVDPVQASYVVGDSVTFTATPDAGWRFVGWSGDVSGTTNPAVVTLTGDTTTTATFEELPSGTVNLTLGVTGSGSVAANPDQSAYTPGEQVTVTATPDPGWQVARFETTPSVVTGWWDDQWDYRAAYEVDAAGVARSDSLVQFDVNFSTAFQGLGAPQTLDVNSLRVVEVDDQGGVVDAAVPFQFDVGPSFDATNSAQGTLWVMLAGVTAGNATRTYHVYFDVAGKGFTPATTAARVTTTDGVAHQGLDTVRVVNDTGTYFYDKDGGGFASILDGDGNDWVSWNTAAGAAGDYRGIPNLVHPGDHMSPGSGTSTTTILSQGPLVTTMQSTSNDGQWVTEWRVGPQHAELTVVQAPGNYWFLYEGTPGGVLNVNSDVVGRSDGTVETANTAWSGDLPGEEWAFFGDPGVGRSLYAVNRQQDAEVDSYYDLSGNMTVFGFGRDGSTPTLQGAPASFAIGLTNGVDFASVNPQASDAVRPPDVTASGSANRTGSITGVDAVTFEMLADQAITAVLEQVPTATLSVTVTGNGTVNLSPDQPAYVVGEQVTLTAVPGAGSVFDRWSGDASGTTNPVTITIGGATAVNAAFVSTASQPQIDIWWGDSQQYGNAGFPQPYYNLHGNVSDPDGMDSLSYTVNGGVSRFLNIGADNRRLARPGDFNADIPFADLAVGSNDVVVTAVDQLGNSASYNVQVVKEPSAVWPTDYTIDWSAAAAIGDVAQVVDGKWALEADGVRMTEPDYDRLLAIGDLNWTDYEVTVPVTINDLDTSAFTSGSSGNGAGLGLLMRWNGHTDNPIANWQPKAGWLPLGAIGWHWWTSETTSQMKITGNGGSMAKTSYGTPPAIGSTLWYKMRVETQPDGTNEYSLKTWTEGTPEPPAWTLTGTSSADDPSSGSLVLIAHHLDATYGDVVVTPLSAPAGNLDLQTVGAGTVTVDPDKTSYAFGEVATLTAVPDPGWVFAGWSGDLTGVQNPASLTFDGSKQVTATFVSASTDPVISGVSVERFVDSAVISWTTDKPTTGEVVYGTTATYGSGPITSATLATSHSVTLTGLAADTTYHFQISATDVDTNTAVTPDDSFRTLAPTVAALTSDDFNECSIDTGLWTYVDPIGDGSLSVNGTQLEIAVPAGTEHNVWSGGNMAPRAMQPVVDADFGVEVKFESMVTERYQLQGLIVEEDVDDFLRFDYYSDGGQVKLFAASFVGGAPTTLANVTVPVTDAPMYLRVTRAGDVWTYDWSIDGSTWTTAASFAHTLNVTTAGVFAGNASAAAPAHTALVDYVFDTASPIVPEDPDTPSCGGSGTPPSISNVAVNTSTDAAVVSWETDEPTTGEVAYGTTAAYGSGPVASTTLSTSHSVTLPALAATTTYHFQISATDVDSNVVLTPDDTFATSSPAGDALVSDDFNTCALDTGVWTWVDPIGDSSFTANGTQLEISVPAGTEHNVWTGGNLAPRVMQAVPNADFGVEVKFDSMVGQKYQMQGLIVEEAPGEYLRFDIYSTGSQARLFAASFTGDAPTTRANVGVSVPGAPVYLRVTRAGDVWTYDWSLDGATWTTVTSFAHDVNVTAAGVFGGNAGSGAPAHTALIDYVFDPASPVVPEDAVVRNCP